MPKMMKKSKKHNDEQMHAIVNLYIELLRRAGNYTWVKGKKMKGRHIKNELFKVADEMRKMSKKKSSNP